jgi:hypothetical protein
MVMSRTQYEEQAGTPMSRVLSSFKAASNVFQTNAIPFLVPSPTWWFSKL